MRQCDFRVIPRILSGFAHRCNISPDLAGQRLSMWNWLRSRRVLHDQLEERDRQIAELRQTARRSLENPHVPLNDPEAWEEAARHCTLTMTLERYTHLDQQKIVAALDAMLPLPKFIRKLGRNGP